MSTQSRRPFTPLEIAILRAVVELGDAAEELVIVQRQKGTPHANSYAAIDRLAAEGYLLRDDRTRYPRVYWRKSAHLREETTNHE